MFTGFMLVSDYRDGHIKVNCQVLKTTTGDYYASKGVYYENTEMLEHLIDLFENSRKQ